MRAFERGRQSGPRQGASHNRADGARMGEASPRRFHTEKHAPRACAGRSCGDRWRARRPPRPARGAGPEAAACCCARGSRRPATGCRRVLRRRSRRPATQDARAAARWRNCAGPTAVWRSHVCSTRSTSSGSRYFGMVANRQSDTLGSAAARSRSIAPRCSRNRQIDRKAVTMPCADRGLIVRARRITNVRDGRHVERAQRQRAVDRTDRSETSAARRHSPTR